MLEIDDGFGVDLGFGSQIANRNFDVVPKLAQTLAVTGDSLAARHFDGSTKDTTGRPDDGVRWRVHRAPPGSILAAPCATLNPHVMSESELDDQRLLEQVCNRNPRAWCVMVRRHESRLREAIREAADADAPLRTDQVDDVVGDLWLLLLEDDLRRLRSFHGDDLGAWLAMVACQVAMNRIRELAREPPTEPLDEELHAHAASDNEKRIIVNHSTRPKVEYVTVSEAARALSVSPKTVYRLVWRGELPSRRVGRTLRIASSALTVAGGSAPRAGIGRTSMIESKRRSRSGMGAR